MGSVKVYSKEFNGKMGYDIEIINEEATVADYLNAINNYILEGKLTRRRSELGICEGCDVCCQERIPLTSIDMLQIMRATGESNLLAAMEANCHIVIDGPTIDITLPLYQDNKCNFLNTESRRCRIYTHRPMVCQTYICCPLSNRAKELRSLIVNLGEDELVRLWLNRLQEEAREVRVQEAYEADVNFDDWEINAFSFKERYQDITLKSLCSTELWQNLTT